VINSVTRRKAHTATVSTWSLGGKPTGGRVPLCLWHVTSASPDLRLPLQSSTSFTDSLLVTTHFTDHLMMKTWVMVVCSGNCTWTPSCERRRPFAIGHASRQRCVYHISVMRANYYKQRQIKEFVGTQECVLKCQKTDFFRTFQNAWTFVMLSRRASRHLSTHKLRKDFNTIHYDMSKSFLAIIRSCRLDAPNATEKYKMYNAGLYTHVKDSMKLLVLRWYWSGVAYLSSNTAQSLHSSLPRQLASGSYHSSYSSMAGWTT